MGRTPLQFSKKPKILGAGSACGGLESQGPLREYFDISSKDSKFNMDTWEKSESAMLRSSIEVAIKKAKLKPDDIDLAFAGDLTNQCASSTFGLIDKKIPHIGLYGACSTFALSLGLAASCIEAGLCKKAIGCSSSHYCSAERQYRFPLEYGCQRTPTAQTTVTGAGSVILGESEEDLPFIADFLPGIMIDLGIHDANNMGAAMAPSCADTFIRYIEKTKSEVSDFDLILTGDLGCEGHRIFLELCEEKGYSFKNSNDCGMMIYDLKLQEVNAGGSGCGCSASVFSGYIMHQFMENRLKDILLIGTGALLNTTTILQNETIPGVSHLIRIRKES